MSRCISVAVAILLAGSAAAQEKYRGVGRTATPAEIAAWDIDVRPDFKGLPAGSGSVAMGQAVWEAKCASCHGTFGESNEVFTPIVGGTTAKDIEAGRVASLKNPEVGRTTMMKLSSLATLWDYINRAMPWNAPKTLTTQEVYAVTAYILNLADIVREDFVLSDRNIGDVQKRLPNRNGMTREHGLWELRGKPDVANTACMKDCPSEVGLMSALPPDATRDTHGNPLEQNRVMGPGRGAPADAPLAPVATAASVPDLARRSGCLTCHGVDKRIVGPTFHEIAVKYRDDVNAQPRLIEKVRVGGSGSWGALAMPAHHDLPEADAKSLVKWILDTVP